MRTDVFRRIFPDLKSREITQGAMLAADHLAVLTGCPLDEMSRSGKLLAGGLLKAREIYQSDFIILFFDVHTEAEALGVELNYSPHHHPQPVKYLSFDELKCEPTAHQGRVKELFRAGEICREALGGEFTIFFSLKDPFSLAALVLGTDNLLTSLISAPSQARKALETCAKVQQMLVEEIVKVGFIPFVGAPIASGSILGRKHFREFAEPYLLKVLNRAEELDSFRCLHLCGEISGLAEGIAALKIDLFSFEDWQAGMWDELPNTIPMGYVPTHLFVSSDADIMENAVRECLSELPKPCVLSSACDIPARSNPELVRVMRRVVESLVGINRIHREFRQRRTS